MADSPTGAAWPRLLNVAIAALDTLPPDTRWSWGGGTSLATHLDHRISFDIDIFVRDADSLRALSPKRNPTVRQIAGRWQEPGHYLKLERDEGEIDFIVSHLMTEPGAENWSFDGRNVHRETVAEIIAKKLHWRGSNALARDVFDFAAARMLAPACFSEAVTAVPDGARRAADFIRRRFSRLKHELPTAVKPTSRSESLLSVDLLSLANDLNDCAGGSVPD